MIFIFFAVIYLYWFVSFFLFFVVFAFCLRRHLPAKILVVKPSLGSVQGMGGLSEEKLGTYYWIAY